MQQDFHTLKLFIDEMKNTSKINEKKKILERYKNNEFIKKVLFYTFTPFKKYHVSSDNLIRHSHLDQEYKGDLFDLLNELHNRVFTGHDAIAFVNNFISKNNQYKNIIYTILDRNLQIRADDKLINKIMPGTIPTFDIALAAKYEHGICNFKRDKFYCSEKIDGLRMVAVIDQDGKVSTWSRSGKQFETMGKVEAEINSLNLKNIVFDGEIGVKNLDGTSDFTGIISEARRKDHTIQNPIYKIFDCLDINDFFSGLSQDILSSRLTRLKLVLPGKYETIEILPQEIIKTNEDFLRWSKMASDNNWEGFMLRRDCEYEGKRSKNLLKVKSFEEAEYVIENVEFDDHRIIKDGKEIVEKMLANVIIKHKGHEVSVGSGFSQEQRRYYYQNPTEIIGSVATINYFEESVDKNGKLSLRFPTLKCIHGERRIF